MEFRTLRADEIEARISQVTKKGCGILLYKNARCDMNILDEALGAFGWQRDHKELKGNMYAGIAIQNPTTKEWIWKWDCGKESNTEAEKGEASDSFKRAGFNWGIGRELYTAPFIWFDASKCNIEPIPNSDRLRCFDTFTVSEIEYVDKKISYLKIVNNKTKAVFTHGKSKNLNEDNVSDYISESEYEELRKLVNDANVNEEKLLAQYGVQSFIELTKVQYTALKNKLLKVVNA
jgi:hypothetical protein